MKLTSYKLNDTISQEMQTMKCTKLNLPADAKCEASFAVDRLCTINFVAVKARQSFYFLKVQQQNSKQNEYCAYFNQCGRKSLHDFVSAENCSLLNNAPSFYNAYFVKLGVGCGGCLNFLY